MYVFSTNDIGNPIAKLDLGEDGATLSWYSPDGLFQTLRHITLEEAKALPIVKRDTSVLMLMKHMPEAKRDRLIDLADMLPHACVVMMTAKKEYAVFESITTETINLNH